jgi:hypothetical protein
MLNIESLSKARLKAIFISAETHVQHLPKTFGYVFIVNWYLLKLTAWHLWQAIEDLQYQAVIINPEQLIKTGGGFEQLVKKEGFTNPMISVHCNLST